MLKIWQKYFYVMAAKSNEHELPSARAVAIDPLHNNTDHR